jgi:hypothetical protein
MKSKKFLAMLLVLAMSISILCIPAYAWTLVDESTISDEQKELVRNAQEKSLQEYYETHPDAGTSSNSGNSSSNSNSSNNGNSGTTGGYVHKGYYDDNGQFWPTNYNATKQATADALTFTSGSRNTATSTGKSSKEYSSEAGFNNDTGSASWTLKDGILTISGTGKVYSGTYDRDNELYDSPFEGNKYIETVVIEKGVMVSYDVLKHLPNLKTVIIMDNSDFYRRTTTNCENLQNVIIGADLLDSELNSNDHNGNAYDGLSNGGNYVLGANLAEPKAKSVANLAVISSAYNGDLSSEITKAKTIISSLNLPSSVLSKLPSNIGGTGAAVTMGTSVNLPSSITYDSWAKSYIEQAYSLGLMNVNSISKDYTGNITRAEFCILADNLYKKLTGDPLNKNPKDNFTDMINCSGAQIRAICNMNGHGVIDGYGDGRFGPTDALTREQASKILSNLADLVGVKTQEVTTPFTDLNTASSWAQSTIGKVYSIGVMNGSTTTTFSPKAAYSREQSIVTIVRLYQAANK